MKITHCKVNRITAPLGFALGRPRFSWQVEEAAGSRQTEARLVVRTDFETLYDTGFAALDSLAVPADIALTPRTAYTWQVTVRTDAGEKASSDWNTFETGKMDEPWQAQWIGCDLSEPRHPVYSRAISPKGGVASARLYLCGLGLFNAYYNGEKIGCEYLTPYCTNYDAWVQAITFDVTDALREAGTLSVALGPGWYAGRFGFRYSEHGYYGDSYKLIAELHIAYADGTEEVIGTDESWQLTRSTVTFSNIYDGEHRDDTLPEVPTVPASTVEPPKGALCDRLSLPVLCVQERPVETIITTPAGETVLDLGQNLAGSFRLKLNVPAGQKVHLQFGEILQNGNFYNDNLRTAKAEYWYTSAGKPVVLEPQFTFFGYRYVKVEGVEDLKKEDFTALVLTSAVQTIGTLSTGNALINRLISNVEWGQRGNFIDVPTDCPQRDERMGWTGDTQVFAPTALYQTDAEAFYAKFGHDMYTEQKVLDGEVPPVVPSFGEHVSSAAWGEAATVVPWAVYEFTGDAGILENQFDSMKAWVDFLEKTDGDDHAWRRHFHYGDWLSLDVFSKDPDVRQGATDLGYVADTQYYRSAVLTAKAARVLGRTADAEHYEALASRIRADIRKEFFTATERLAIPTQTGYLLALSLGLCEEPQRMADGLMERFRLSEGKLQTGFVGTPLLCPILTQIGHADLAFDLLFNEEYPGWLYEVKMGATTVWERWNSVLPDGSISDTGMNSLNHYAYGSILEWVYADVAGIRPAEPGFRKALLAPHFDERLGEVNLTYRSAAGTWQIHWEVKDGAYTYRCTVPFGCTATLVLPGKEPQELTAGTYEEAGTF